MVLLIEDYNMFYNTDEDGLEEREGWWTLNSEIRSCNTDSGENASVLIWILLLVYLPAPLTVFTVSAAFRLCVAPIYGALLVLFIIFTIFLAASSYTKHDLYYYHVVP